ncbi:MAG: magnesium transporter [Candidatus Hodarchaeota archaeon]
MGLDHSVIKKIYREVTPFVILTALAEIGAGALLTGLTNFYAILPGLILLLPGLMEARGNISASLGQRLGSAIHVGVIDWKLGFNDDLKENVKSSLLLGFVVAFVLACLAFFVSSLVGLSGLSLLGFVLIALLTAFFSGITQIAITVLVALYSAHKGLDPDNITIPVLATLGDVFTVFYLLIVVRIVVWAGTFLPI